MNQEQNTQQNEQAWDKLLESQEGSDFLKKLAQQAKQDLKDGNISPVGSDKTDIQ